MVSRMSRGGMQVIIESLRKSGVPMAWFHCRGVGRSTTTPRSSSAFTRFSRQALPTSTVRSGRRPHMPRISESTGTFSEVAGSSGGMTELSHRPTITRFSGSQSFQELTIFAMTVSFLRQRFRRRLFGWHNYKLQLRWRERHGLDPVVASPSRFADEPVIPSFLFNCNIDI